MSARLLNHVESMLERFLNEADDANAVCRLTNLVRVLRKDRIHQLERRIAELQLGQRYTPERRKQLNNRKVK